MTYTFTQTQLDEIQRILDEEVPDVNGTYVPVYNYIYSLITDTSGPEDVPAAGVDKSVWLYSIPVISAHSVICSIR